MNCAIQGNSSSNNHLRNSNKTPNPQKFVSEITQFERENQENSLKDTSKIIQNRITDTNLIYSNNLTNKGNTEGNDKKIILRKFDKKLFESINKPARKKEFISNETFEAKIKNFKSCLEELKIDWREAHCQLSITREHMLEDTLKKIGLTDPYKVKF